MPSALSLRGLLGRRQALLGVVALLEASFFDRSAASALRLGVLLHPRPSRAVPQRTVLIGRPVVKLPPQIVDRRRASFSAACCLLSARSSEGPQSRVAPRFRVLQGLALVPTILSNSSNRASASRARRSAASSASVASLRAWLAARLGSEAPSATRRAPASPASSSCSVLTKADLRGQRRLLGAAQLLGFVHVSL